MRIDIVKFVNSVAMIFHENKESFRNISELIIREAPIMKTKTRLFQDSIFANYLLRDKESLAKAIMLIVSRINSGFNMILVCWFSGLDSIWLNENSKPSISNGYFMKGVFLYLAAIMRRATVKMCAEFWKFMKVEANNAARQYILTILSEVYRLSYTYYRTKPVL